MIAFEWVQSPLPSRWTVWLTIDGDRVAVTAMDEPEAALIYRALDTGDYDNRGAVPDVRV